MKNKFFQHKNDAIGNAILTAILILVLFVPSILNAHTLISLGLAVILIPIIVMGFMQGLRNQEFDIISFSKEGVTTRRFFTKAFIKWESVSSVKYGKMKQPSGMRGEKDVRKLIIHAVSEDDGSAIKLFMDDKAEILESIKYYKELSKKSIDTVEKSNE